MLPYHTMKSVVFFPLNHGGKATDLFSITLQNSSVLITKRIKIILKDKPFSPPMI